MTQPAPQQPRELSDLVEWLIYQHSQDQQALAAKTAAGLRLLWPILQFARLDETTTTWLHAVTLQIQADFDVSEQTAFEFVQNLKWAVEPLSDPLEKVNTTFPVADVQNAMRITGPVHVKSIVNTAPADEVMARAEVTSTGAGVKHVMNGGRGEVQQLVERDAPKRIRDRKPIGYRRVTDENPCYFCAMLAARGATYLTAESFDETNRKIRDIKQNGKVVARRAFVGEGNFKVHDHCQCTLVPVYSKRSQFDARALNFREQFKKVSGFPASDQLKEFRKIYIPPSAPVAAPVVDVESVRANREAIRNALGANAPQVVAYDQLIRKLA